MNVRDFSNKKVLIFSDTHLKCSFISEHFNALKKQILKADIVIINGDFWENISCDFQDFIKTDWAKKLFPLLKNKKSFLIHGNHDSLEFVKNEEILKNIFMGNFNEFEFKSGDRVFHLEHGHLLARKYHGWRERLIIFLKKINLYKFLKNQEWLEIFYNQIGRKVFICYKEKALSDKSKFYIFGHIHLPKHNLRNNYSVIGSFKRGRARYIFIENGKIEFHNEKY